MYSLAEQISRLRQWVKTGQSPVPRAVFRIAKTLRTSSIPVIPPIHAPLYALHRALSSTLGNLARICWYTPLFQTRLTKPAPRMYLYGGMPLILGNLKCTIGADCRVAGRVNLSGRTSTRVTPELIVGNNCDIGWGSSIAVGTTISLGDNVRLSANVHLAGYPGHPLNAEARARGEPETDDQVGDIILEDDVWLATGTTVLKGVRIGRGTIVGAGSVVTKDLPHGVLAAGAPARVVRVLPAATTSSPNGVSPTGREQRHLEAAHLCAAL